MGVLSPHRTLSSFHRDCQVLELPRASRSRGAAGPRTPQLAKVMGQQSWRQKACGSCSLVGEKGEAAKAMREGAWRQQGSARKGEPWTFFSPKAGRAMRRQEEAQAGGRGKGTVRQQVQRSHTNQGRQDRQDREAAGAAAGAGVMASQVRRKPCGFRREGVCAAAREPHGRGGRDPGGSWEQRATGSVSSVGAGAAGAGGRS